MWETVFHSGFCFFGVRNRVPLQFFCFLPLLCFIPDSFSNLTTCRVSFWQCFWHYPISCPILIVFAQPSSCCLSFRSFPALNLVFHSDRFHVFISTVFPVLPLLWSLSGRFLSFFWPPPPFSDHHRFPPMSFLVNEPVVVIVIPRSETPQVRQQTATPLYVVRFTRPMATRAWRWTSAPLRWPLTTSSSFPPSPSRSSPVWHF